MPERLRLGLVFGGRSVEHEVSIVSAQHVIAAAEPDRFEVVPFGVTKEGIWLTAAETQAQLARPEAPFQKRLLAPSSGSGRLMPDVESLAGVDIVFPLIHGRHGEDGTLQGLLELLDLPYIGCGVAASAIGMDKALMKAVFRGEGLPVAEHIVARIAVDSDVNGLMREVEQRFGYPVFVKPANGGLSLGVSKARDREGLAVAIQEAAKLDRKLVIEKGIEGREVECGVLGNEDAEASPIGEIRHQRDFYDYEAKYLDPATQILTPTDLPPDVAARVQAMALRAFQSIGASGMSRVDFFLCPDGSLVLDEINTIPGFTPASMFPRLWDAAGVHYTELISRLVALAIAHHKEKPVA